jgi:amphi-Trp domain-containing protein
MGEKRDRDVEKVYSTSEFVAKLRRLADALETGERFEIQVAGERVYVPARAEFNVEHEREEDEASGTMAWDGETYRFSEVVLRPRVVIEAGGDLALAEELLHRSHELCFIARSVNFPVRHEPELTAGAVATS